jgi:hypothetical protein
MAEIFILLRNFHQKAFRKSTVELLMVFRLRSGPLPLHRYRDRPSATVTNHRPPLLEKKN